MIRPMIAITTSISTSVKPSCPERLWLCDVVRARPARVANAFMMVLRDIMSRLRAAGFGFAAAEGATSIGSSLVGGGVCAEPSAGSSSDDREQTRPRRHLRATGKDGDIKRLAVTWHVTANADWRIAEKAVLRSHQDAPARCARV